jgi:hypothetical protein
MKDEDVAIIEILLFNTLSTLNALLAATATGKFTKEDQEGFLRQAQDTQNLLRNINTSKQHKKTYKSCFGCKYHDLNHIATMCRLDINSNSEKFACHFKKESEESNE